MHRKYEKSPITEAVCEFRLPPDSPWDLTIPGLFYEKISDEFESKEEHPFTNIVLTTTAEGTAYEQKQDKVIRFLQGDQKKIFIQLGNRFVSTHHLQPYISWEDFKPKINKAFKALDSVETVNPKSFQRIGLRYINSINIPRESGIENYFTFRPSVGKNSPGEMKTFIVGCVFPFSDGRDSCKVQLTDNVPIDTNSHSYTLDIDYFLAQPLAIPINKTLEWVDNAHAKVEEIFEWCITDKLRKIFKEIK